MLKGAMYRHESGVYMLAEPKDVSEVEEITASKIKAVLNLLRGWAGMSLWTADIPSMNGP